MKHLTLHYLLLTLLLLLSACDSPSDAARAIGYIEVEWQYVAAPQSGWIVNRPIAQGQRVASGDLLFELDYDKEAASLNEAERRVSQAKAESQNQQSGARAPEIRRLEAQLEEARAQLERATAERTRIMPLVEQGVEPGYRGDLVEANYRAAQAGVTSAEQAVAVARLPARGDVIDAGTAAYQAAAAAHNGAELRLADRKVHARVPGRIEDIFYREGEFARAGEPVLAILPDDGLYVHFFVAQDELATLKTGDHVSVTADGIDNPIEAEVTRIATEAEFTPPVIYSSDVRSKLVFLIEARLPSAAPLHPGLPVDVNWP